MAINPFRVGELQLPQPLWPVPIDFSPLQSIGEGIGQYRQQQQIGGILAGATGPDGQLDLNKAARDMAAAGFSGQANRLLDTALRQQAQTSAEKDRAETRALTERHYRATEGTAAEQLKIQQQQAADARDAELQARLAAAKRGPLQVAPGSTVLGPDNQPVFTGPRAPMQVAPGATVLGPDNQPVFTGPLKPELKTVAPGASVINEKGESVFTAPPPASIYDAETLSALARQARAGDTSVFTNVGRGAQGAENIAALRREIARQNTEAGTTPEEQAVKNAEYFGTKAGQRTLGTRTANIEQAVTEAQQLAPLVLEASNKVDRTRFPLLNSVILAAERGTGDENVVRLGVAINGMINVYARAINPTGVPTVSDKEHARDILQAAWSKGQIGAAIDQMNKEMAAARAAPGAVKQQMREDLTGKKTQTAPTGPVGIDEKKAAAYQQTPAAAINEARAAIRDAPPDKKAATKAFAIQQLRSLKIDVDPATLDAP